MITKDIPLHGFEVFWLSGEGEKYLEDHGVPPRRKLFEPVYQPPVICYRVDVVK